MTPAAAAVEAPEEALPAEGGSKGEDTTTAAATEQEPPAEATAAAAPPAAASGVRKPKQKTKQQRAGLDEAFLGVPRRCSGHSCRCKRVGPLAPVVPKHARTSMSCCPGWRHLCRAGAVHACASALTHCGACAANQWPDDEAEQALADALELTKPEVHVRLPPIPTSCARRMRESPRH